MKRLIIINADEFGLTEGTNRAIIETYKFGTVTSTTMIVNMWAFDDAVRLAKENPWLGVGIHLNLTDGKPVLHKDKVRSLVNSDGFFYNRKGLIIRLLQHKVNLEEVKREFNAQIDKLITNGIYPTHIDTHQAIILLPSLFWIIKDLAKELKLPLILPVDGSMPFSFKKTRWIKRGYAYFIGRRYRRILKKEGILMQDNFYKVVDFFMNKITTEDSLLNQYTQVLSSSIKNGTSYLMTHPSYICDNLINFMHRSQMMAKQREEELKTLLNPALIDSIRHYGLRLVSFGDIIHENSPNKSSI